MMDVEVSGPSLSALMAPYPKIITAAADAALWQAAAPPKPIEIFSFAPGPQGRNGRLGRLGEHRPEDAGFRDTENTIPLGYAPNACMALVALSDRAAAELDVFERWWAEIAPDNRPALGQRIEIADWPRDQQRCYAALFERMAQSQAEDSRRIIELQKELCALRALHEESQIIFSNLSDYIAQVHLPEEQLIYAANPSHISIYPQAAREKFRVAQLLPVPSLGLAALELHIHAVPPGGQGRLHIALTTLEDGDTLGLWTLGGAGLQRGWVRLDLSQAVTGPRRSVQLTIRWEGEPKAAPSLSLTEQRLIKECWLKVNDSAIVQRTLALRVWSGLPGLRRTATKRQKSDPAVAGSGFQLERRPIAARLRAAAKLVRPTEKLVDYELLGQINDQGVLQLHPLDGGQIAVAQIPGGCPADARQIFATVKTNHPDAQPVEYAMMVLAAGETLDQFPGSGNDAKTSNFSGWTAVPANVESGLTVFLERSFSSDADLYIATRMPAGKSNAFAWAWWLDFAALIG